METAPSTDASSPTDENGSSPMDVTQCSAAGPSTFVRPSVSEMEQHGQPNEFQSSSVASLSLSAVAESVQLKIAAPSAADLAQSIVADAPTHSADNQSPIADEQSSTPPYHYDKLIWRGLFVCSKQGFNCTCTAVSGGNAVYKAGREMMASSSENNGSTDGGGGRIHLIGLSDSRGVWEYVMKLKESWDKIVCLLVINRPEEEKDLVNYMTCFFAHNHQQGSKLGVLDFAGHPTITDGYMFTLSSAEPLPPALLPLDGVGLPDWTQQDGCIMLMIVRRMDHDDKLRKHSLMATLSKKSVFLQSLQSLSTSAKLLPEEIFEQNEQFFDERIQYFRLMLNRMNGVPEKTTLGSGFPSDLGGLGTGTGTTFVQRHNYQFGTAASGSFHSSDDSLSVSMDCAMFAPEELTMSVVGNQIVVEGKHGEKQDSFGSIERRFVRKFAMPRNATADLVKSNFTSDGMLTVTASAPKAKKTQFIQTVNALFVSAQCFHPKLFDQNEVLFDERIQYLRVVQKTMDTMAAAFSKSQDAENKRGRKRRHSSGP
ncbi:hypothetical protein niasHT_030844 [Heterodera trifolii]|uniref:SHSP domain-containing protein n=1 Tax=Heterodera trifolii TaxID=157864 RepID=A0ABD2I5Y6_9BILA